MKEVGKKATTELIKSNQKSYCCKCILRSHSDLLGIFQRKNKLCIENSKETVAFLCSFAICWLLDASVEKDFCYAI